jgi:tripartite-type tricarboxylate transporter receptor subunit TctC
MMNLRRRTFLQLGASAAIVSAVPWRVLGQTYPARQVRLLVGFAPGGAADIAARMMGHTLSASLGQQFVVENRPGAATNIATEAVLRSPPDGYTLLLATTANTINQSLYPRLNFDFAHDSTPIASIVQTIYVMVANPSLPVQTLPEFIGYAKANPGKINMASGGNGSPPHVAGELFKMMAGIDALHIPYRGDGPAIAGLIGGQVQFYFATLGGAIEQIRSGKLRALAVSGRTRSHVLPDIPAMAEYLPGYEATGWLGLVGPKNTSAEIAEKLNRATNAGFIDIKVTSAFANLGLTTLPGSRTEFETLIARETEKWAKVVKFAGLKPD